MYATYSAGDRKNVKVLWYEVVRRRQRNLRILSHHGPPRDHGIGYRLQKVIDPVDWFLRVGCLFERFRQNGNPTQEKILFSKTKKRQNAEISKCPVILPYRFRGQMSQQISNDLRTVFRQQNRAGENFFDRIFLEKK